MEFNYLVEKRRMLDSLGRMRDEAISCLNVDCTLCPLSKYASGSGFNCRVFEIECPIEATKIVRKWAEEHPRKTRRDVLLEKFPNVVLNKKGQPCVCAQMLGLRDYDNICEDKEECLQCWNMEVEE